MSASEASNIAKDDLSPSEALLTPSQPQPSKLASPAPLEASLTPPPSTQQPQTNKVIARTPTPQASLLSSPPPTKLAEPVFAEHVDQSVDVLPTEWVANASADELRERMSELATALRQARAEAASYKMQYGMLRMESTEQNQRMGVELEMVQREVEVLQVAEARRQAANAATKSPYTDPNAANATLLHEMSRHCAALQRENEDYQDINAQLYRKLEHRMEEIARLTEANDRLRTRIRTNREHTNSYLEYINENSPQPLFSTPQHATPRSRAPLRTDTMLSVPPTGLAPIDALLAAGKYMSQETATAPTTPHRGNAGKRGLGHRTAHSLSSLPSTPQRARGMTNQSILQTPPQFTPVAPTAPMTGPLPRTSYASTGAAPAVAPYSSSRRHMRAGSSDSTITASSVEGGDRMADEDDEQATDDEIPESQASQAATSMLRRTSMSKSMHSQSNSQRSSFAANSGGGGGGLRQTKLFGQITKPGVGGKSVEKRRLSDVGGVGDQQSPASLKRARLSEGVGLGIH